MNNERRKAIRLLAERLDVLRGQIDEVKGDIENLRDEEQDYFDTMPEGFQQGDKGQKAEAAVEALDEALTAVESMDGEIDQAIGALSSAEE